MNETTPNPEIRIALFQHKEIRRTIHHNEWWFVVEDVVLALIDSRDPKQYVQRMKQRDPELAKGWVQFVHTQGFPENKTAAHAGGTVAGNARRELEQKSGRKVVTSENYLALTQSVRKAKALAKPTKQKGIKP
jgi:hypothetical protein